MFIVPGETLEIFLTSQFGLVEPKDHQHVTNHDLINLWFLQSLVVHVFSYYGKGKETESNKRCDSVKINPYVVY